MGECRLSLRLTAALKANQWQLARLTYAGHSQAVMLGPSRSFSLGRERCHA